ncbi:uncharacterized protein LOC115561867 isoform X3 [Drosophila navojoa]|uniref:uncharacterized protein LOC115561867 isoform X3 n=1 Tax=Drosophila navojoa TaxID=7232 RepID=UPI0011BF1A47|nr:uncharacterized protein LOC115561867 isoform X3 [Drosophila navojoa]
MRSYCRPMQIIIFMEMHTAVKAGAMLSHRGHLNISIIPRITDTDIIIIIITIQLMRKSVTLPALVEVNTAVDGPMIYMLDKQVLGTREMA